MDLTEGSSRNGYGAGINRPSAEAQEAVIRKAYAKAHLGFDQTGYFEWYVLKILPDLGMSELLRHPKISQAKQELQS